MVSAQGLRQGIMAGSRFMQYFRHHYDGNYCFQTFQTGDDCEISVSGFRDCMRIIGSGHFRMPQEASVHRITGSGTAYYKRSAVYSYCSDRKNAKCAFAGRVNPTTFFAPLPFDSFILLYDLILLAAFCNSISTPFR